MIPQVILPYVFQQLNDKELLKCSIICKLWYKLTFDPLLSRNWKNINFQEKIEKLTNKYVRDSVTVTSHLKKEEKMNWEKIYKIVLKRGKNNIQYLKLWSCFNSQQINMVISDGSLNNLITLDLRGTNYDISLLFEVNIDKDKIKLIKGKEKEKQNDNKNYTKDIDVENKINVNNNGEIEKSKNNKDKKIQKVNDEEKTTKVEKVNNNKIKNQIKDINSNDNSEKILEKTPKKPQYFLDSFKHLKYLYIYRCKNVNVETIEKIHNQWKNIVLDVKVCHECHELTKICSDKKLKSDPNIIEKLSHCSVCKKEYCDHCHPLWTCEVCGGDPTCYDCRAHGIKCTTCDCDYCYTCNQPKKILQCRYCHNMTCGQSSICQNLGYLYKACDKCDYYVCNKCRDDQDNLMICSGKNCTKSFCKTCINESVNNSLISFDKSEVEKRVRENNFALCSYCNKLYCISCIDNISFYIGSKDIPYCIILCKECETFYKTQLINLFRMPQHNASTSNGTDRRRNSSSIHTTSYTDNLITMTQTNLLTSNTLSIDSPIDVFNYDQYIR